MNSADRILDKHSLLCAADVELFKALGLRMNSISRVEATAKLRVKLGLGHKPLGKRGLGLWLIEWFQENHSGTRIQHKSKQHWSKKKSKSNPKDESEEIRMTNYTRTKEYDTYLKSDLWNAIRRFVLLTASYTCKGCSRPAELVHHTSYDTMTMRGRDISKLVALCRECHEHIEFTEDGSKSTLTQANDRLLALLAQKENAPCTNHQQTR